MATDRMFLLLLLLMQWDVIVILIIKPRPLNVKDFKPWPSPSVCLSVCRVALAPPMCADCGVWTLNLWTLIRTHCFDPWKYTWQFCTETLRTQVQQTTASDSGLLSRPSGQYSCYIQFWMEAILVCIILGFRFHFFRCDCPLTLSARNQSYA